MNAFYQTRDSRHIFFTGACTHRREGTLQFLDCSNEHAAIARRVSRHDAQALEDALSNRGLCAVILRSREEWRAHAQGQALAGVPPVELLRITDSQPIPLKLATWRPLEGLRVLDFSHVVAGSTIAKLLAEHGADEFRWARSKLRKRF